jgi:transposase-like protein
MSETAMTYDGAFLVCPYCSHKHQTADLEGEDGSFQWRCEACDQWFQGSVVIEVTYEGRPLPPEQRQQ